MDVLLVSLNLPLPHMQKMVIPPSSVSFGSKVTNQSFLGNVQPGTLGGGASPSGVIGTSGVVASAQTLATAIALVPLGLTPIAVFPPYANPRTVPTVSVIFAEDQNAR